ncbi:MAG: MazG nucleotide pyrophosphohydrolase domain-containing protein [Phycisphaerae bacterium]
MTLDELQALIEKMYSDKDRERGTSATFLWFCEEVGELASSLREGDRGQQAAEFADVLAWLVTLANINDVNLTRALRAKYGDGCPGCGKWVCECGGKP